jgi:hypothetical protein
MSFGANIRRVKVRRWMWEPSQLKHEVTSEDHYKGLSMQRFFVRAQTALSPLRLEGLAGNFIHETGD